jgi:pyridinium-3,5-bisthiocarboxylic acid mononucleotide nickel chelatase
MILGALLDLGLPLDELRRALGSLAIDHGTIAADRVLRAGISATKFRLLEPGHTQENARTGPEREAAGAHAHGHAEAHAHAAGHPHDHGHHDHAEARHVHDHAPRDHDHDGGHLHESHGGGHGHYSLHDIRRHIDRSALSGPAKARARELFERLADAEASIHDMPVERVHLHEVGAIDSIVDIVGCVFGMEWLGAARVVASPVNVGGGTVRCAHGVFPVPAPATATLLTGVPVYAGEVKSELTTPTGALLVTAYADSFGPVPGMRLTAVGYGAGDRDFPGHPNVLRMMVGESAAGRTIERLLAIECEIDDMNPQLFGPLMERLYAAGALEVYYAAVQMKKNRPGTLVTVLAGPESREAISSVLFTETTTIGVRYHEMERERLDRQVSSVETPYGAIRMKIATRSGRVVNAAPEFEDCARVARERGLPIKDVQAAATRAWLERVS